MPKITFERLPKVKKEELLRVALKEFAGNDYEHASVTRMVKTLDIAKGSIYQYFENKKDLYEYLLRNATEVRKKYINPVLYGQHKDISQLLGEFIFALVKFEIDYPYQSRLLYNAYNEKFSKDLGDQSHQNRKKNMDFMRGLIERELLRGNLWADLDIGLLSYVVSQVHNGITDYLMILHGIDAASRLNSRKLKKAITDESIREIANQVALFVQRGLVRQS